MKTTIELPDAILERTKVAAARRRTSMKNLVIQGLEMVLQNEVAPAAPAESSGTRELLSEDLKHGQNYGQVCVINPFLA